MRCTGCQAPLSQDARFCGQCGARCIRPPLFGVAAFIDTTTMADHRVGGRCLLRLRLLHAGAEPILGGALSWSAARHQGELTLQGLRPGEERALSLVFRPEEPGHHELSGVFSLRSAAGQRHAEVQALHFRVAPQAPLQQNIHIDASAQRVGIFENIGAAERGGLLGPASWQLLPLTATEAPAAKVTALKPGTRGVAVVERVDAQGVWATLQGTTGRVVQLDDPSLLGVLSPGDKLSLSVLGVNGAGHPLLGTGVLAAPAEAPATQVRDLAEALRTAPPGAVLQVPPGEHHGPFIVNQRVELVGAPGAVLLAPRGAVLTLRESAVLTRLRIQSAAPPGGYSPDGVVVRGGRVRLVDCEINLHTPNALTPGRALALCGPAQVEMQGGSLQHAGVGAAVDTAWSGFPETTARGARLVLRGVHLSHNQTGVAVSGDGRSAELLECTFASNRVPIVAQGGAFVAADPCPTGNRVDPSSRLRSS